MSCDAVAAAATLWLAAFSPTQQTPAEQALGTQPAAVIRIAAAPPKISGEPMYRDIVKQAKSLKGQVDGYIKAAAKADPNAAAAPLAGFDSFKSKIGVLAEADMKGHLDLAARNLDGDLKCILRGIAQDLPKRLDEVVAAKDGRAQTAALKEMAYLLNDNVEVITAPPAPPV